MAALCLPALRFSPRPSTSPSSAFLGLRPKCRSPAALSDAAASVLVMAAVDPWAPGASVDSQSVASLLFAASLFPYLGFLYHITRSKSAPGLTLFGFYFLLAFVGATSKLIGSALLDLTLISVLVRRIGLDSKVPAGIYAKVHYGTSLSNVDWLHGGAESLLTVTNLLIVLGLRKALRRLGESRAAEE